MCTVYVYPFDEMEEMVKQWHGVSIAFFCGNDAWLPFSTKCRGQ